MALYAVIQMLVAGIHLHRVPAYTSMFLWGLLGTAAVVGCAMSPILEVVGSPDAAFDLTCEW